MRVETFLLLLLPHAFGATAYGRKTLNFGTRPPHTWYTASSELGHPAVLFSNEDSSHPLQLAGDFIKYHIASSSWSKSPEDHAFFLRQDSYTDDATGITHVYARQVLNNLEVVDGDISINIKDGKVLSFASSFSNNPPEDLSVPSDVFKDETMRNTHLGPPAQTIFVPGSSQPSKTSHGYRMKSAKSALLHLMGVVTPSDEVQTLIFASGELLLDDITVDHAPRSDRFDEALLLSHVPGAVAPVKAHLAYATNAHGRPELAWKFEVEMQDNWYEAAVSVQLPYRIISIVDWVSDSPTTRGDALAQALAHYNVFALGVNDPVEGERTIELERNDTLASPMGWHSLPYANDPSVTYNEERHGDLIKNTTTTWGNNVFAQANWKGDKTFIGSYRPDGGVNRTFDFKYDPKPGNQENALSEAREYVNATVTQVFYVSNLLHDLFYRYGFSEAAGNFQQHNFGRGGKENDAVVIDTQDGSGLNNGNFVTPPDGQNPRCRMYLWNTAYPWRDGAYDEGVLVHELSHGLSSRLTGGPDNAACMGFGESNGMGEGWSDFIALLIRSKKDITDYPTGVWVGNKPQGLRHYLYSLNTTTNPLTYDSLNRASWREVHAMGEVWTSILWEVAQSLVAVHGYRSGLFPPEATSDGQIPLGDFYRSDQSRLRVPKHGNTLALQLVISGMKLQPCKPTFLQARDAIILADEVLTGGENLCTLWNAFAKRGLGMDAQYKNPSPSGGGRRVNGFDVPVACKK